MNERLMTCLMIVLVPVISTAVGNDSVQTVDPLMTLAAARVKAEIAIRDGSAVFDRTKNGYVAAETAIELNKDKITDLLSRSKDSAEDKKFAAECEKMMSEIDRKWDNASREYDTDISVRYDDASDSFGDLRSIFDSLADTEQEWKRAKLDLEPLALNFSALEKRIAETVEQGAKAIADLKDRQKTWDDELLEVEKFISQHAEKANPDREQ